VFCFFLQSSARGVLGTEDDAVLLGDALGRSVEEGELDLGGVELLNPGAAALVIRDGLNAHNFDLSEASTVASSHIVVGLRDGAGLGDVTEFLNHGGVTALLGIVDKGDGVVAGGELLVADDGAGEDVTLGGLNLILVVHESPEAGFGDDVVGSEDFVLEDGGVSVLLGGSFATNDLVVLQVRADHCVLLKCFFCLVVCLFFTKKSEKAQ